MKCHAVTTFIFILSLAVSGCQTTEGGASSEERELVEQNESVEEAQSTKQDESTEQDEPVEEARSTEQDEPTEESERGEKPEPFVDARGASSYQPTFPGLELEVCRSAESYESIELDRPDAAACKQNCLDQARCAAFTLILPGYLDDTATAYCQLQDHVSDKTTGQTGCISWVKPSAKRRIEQLRARGFEWNVDRPGSTYRESELERPRPEACQEACLDSDKCEAFTYVHPAGDGDTAHCRLKDSIPDKETAQNCCVSGIR